MKLLTVMLFLPIAYVNGQTKQETESWLLFNLNKYMGDNFESFSHPGSEYSYYSYSYQITSNKLIYTEYTHHVANSSRPPGVITSQKRTTINLNKIVKVTQENNADSTFPFKFVNIYFNFDEYPDPKNQGVKQFDEINQRDLTGNTYYTLFTATFSVDPNALKENMPARFVKALEHLAELNGAKIIKDVF